MRRNFTWLGLFLWIAGTFLFAGVNSWTTGGPYGGEIMTLAVDYQTPNVIYLGTKGGGVYKSQNWGQSWAVVNNGLGEMEVDAMVMDPQDHNTLYIGQILGVSKSTDGGNHWYSASIGLQTNSFLGLDISKTDPRILYVACYNDNGGVFKSTNGGDSWSRVNTGLTSLLINCVAVDPTTPNVAYAGSYDKGVFRTTNGGGSWTAVNNGVTDLSIWSMVIDPQNPQTLYIGAHGGGVFKSTNRGGSWQAVNNGQPGTYIIGLAIDALVPSTLYAGSLYGVSKSTDGGASWSDFGTGTAGSFYFHPAADPRSSSVVYTGTSFDGLYRSVDGGANWVPANYSLTGTYVECVAVPPDLPDTAYAGCGGHIFETADAGRSWQVQPGSQYAMDLEIDPQNPQIMYGCPLYGVVKTTDRGVTWTDASAGLPTDAYIRCVAINPVNPQVLYAGLSPHSPVPSIVYRSLNGGQSWYPTPSPDSTNEVMDLLIDPRAPNTVYAAVWGTPGIFKTTDGGMSWDAAGSGLTSHAVYCLAMDPHSSSFLYAGTSGGGLNRSTNAGQYWSPANNGLGSNSVLRLAVDPDDSNIVFAGTALGLYHSIDRGTSWSLSTLILATAMVNGLAVTSGSPKTVYAGTGGGVYNITYDAAPSLDIYARVGQSGEVNPGAPSQLLPASPLLIALSNHALDGASSTNPVIIEIRLPEGAVLSQTLADGELSDLAVLPPEKSISALAVSEYGFNLDSATYEPTQDYVGTGPVSVNAVQLFRYVAGEDKIWLRVTDSTIDWTVWQPGDFLGVTVGVGAGVWPPNGSSNWSEAGLYLQGSTQFFGDLRGYDFDAKGDLFPVTVRAFYQVTGMDLDVNIVPNSVNLFLRENSLAETAYGSGQVGGVLTDYALVDLNGDGLEDILSVDGPAVRLYWSYRQADGAFGGRQWVALPGAAPVTVKAADVTGDGKPDVLETDAAGQLWIYPWESIFGPIFMKEGRGALAPAKVLTLAGVASASAVQDLNGDWKQDFLYTDAAAGTLNILFGQSFTASVSYATGAGPAAIAVGDFDGNAVVDIAVANQSGNSVSVYHNDGAGHLSRTDYAAGNQPVSVAAADFNRDGRADLALALAGDKALAVWPAQSGGTFSPGAGQRIFFQNPPSAVQADNFDGANGADALLGFADYYKLALCVSDPAGVLSYAYAINSLGDVELDPVNHVTLTENNVLSVAGGTSAGGVCTRGGVAAVAEQSFNLVHLPRSQDLSFSVVNLGSQTALLNLELYDDTGSLRQAVTQPVGVGQQYARYLSDAALFGSAADNAQRWVRGFVTVPDTYGFWLANDGSTLNYLDGLPLGNVRDAQSSFVLAMAPGPGGFVQAILTNPYQQQAQVNLQLVGGGSVKAAIPFTLAGRARVVVNPAQVFPAVTADDYLYVQADRPLLGCEVYGDGQKLAALAGQAVPAAAAPLYCPHVASGDLGVNYETRLTLVNPTDQDTAVVMRLYSDGGILESTTPVIGVPARSKRTDNVAPLFGAFGAFTGSVSVEVLGPGAVTGAVTFGEAGAGRFLSSLPLLTQTGTDYLVGHIANGTLGPVAFFTGLAVLNPGGAGVAAEVAAYDQNGLPQGTTNLSLGGHAREVFLLDQRLAGLQSQFGGYLRIRVTSGDGVMVFALFGDQQLNFLSAVEAQAVRE